MTCPSCGADVMPIDVRCGACGAALGASGAHRMIGQTVLDTYQLVDVLGQGGMSVVFKAKHKMTDQEVALKILPPELAAHSQVKSRFLEEAKALAALDHPNIVHLYNFGQENGAFVLAMQFVQGKTWERMILENERLDWVTSCRIAIDVLKALEYAHGRGVVHRDMKPSNVLVRAHDGSATVMDFGIAKMTTSTRLTATGQTMGTVRYMSPEQVRGQEVDLRTDIYSLGATLYESLVGDTPFGGSTHFEIMTKHLSEPPKPLSAHGVTAPSVVEEAVMRSLAKRAGDRFESAREMRKLLEAGLREGDVALVETQKVGRDRLLADLRAPARPSAPLPRAASASDLADRLEPASAAAPPARRARWPYVVLAAVVIGGGAGLAAMLATSGRPGGKRAPAHAEPRIPGVALKPSVRFAAQHLVVATDGGVEPRAVAAAYGDALASLREFARTALPGLSIADPIDQILAVPQSALCEPSLYLGSAAPHACATVPAAVADALPRTLLVVADPARLPAAMRQGVADAVCTFQPVEEADARRRRARIDEICSKTTEFITAGRP
ncbi:MAG TPA: protein kinase [Kofleriaceae bacterium]|nr:protein kinase [Kofleriaceae bacterium]